MRLLQLLNFRRAIYISSTARLPALVTGAALMAVTCRAEPQPQYRYFATGDPADVISATTGLAVLQAGGDDVDENYVRMGVQAAAATLSCCARPEATSTTPISEGDLFITDRFNRAMQFEYEKIRDFLALHYNRTERNDSAFWDYCRTMSIPEYLEDKISLFQSRGRIFCENEELFNDTSWFAVMIGRSSGGTIRRRT